MNDSGCDMRLVGRLSAVGVRNACGLCVYVCMCVACGVYVPVCLCVCSNVTRLECVSQLWLIAGMLRSGAHCSPHQPTWELMRQQLTLPADIAATPRCRELFPSGVVAICPAYFRVLQWLAGGGAGETRVSIVFRTFGSDLPHIIKCEA